MGGDANRDHGDFLNNSGRPKTPAAAIAAPSRAFEVPPDPIPHSSIKETTECDVVVVGAGISGTPAAMKAAEMGATVCVLEKGPTYGPHRTGGFAAFGTRAQTAAGIELSQELKETDPGKAVGCHDGLPGPVAADRSVGEA